MAGNQVLVAWSTEFELDMPEVDAQHRVLVDLINDLWGAIVNNADAAQTVKVVEGLEKYTIAHFAVEEIFMREIGYSNFANHKAEHEKFVARIASEKAKIQAGQKATLDLVRFLKDWLINHILVSDKEYAGEYKKRQEPSSMLGRFFKRLKG